jgi:hypothetical protein
VEPVTLAFACVLVVVLLGLAGFYAWRQKLMLGRLRRADDLAAEDRLYLRNQVWRRLAGCVLMVLLAGLVAGWFLAGLNQQAIDVGEQAAAQRAQGGPVRLDADQKRAVNVFSLYWIVTLLVLLAFLATAALDLWAIYRYGLRHHRQIAADRRAMIADELARLRSQRNGHA